MTMVSSSMTWLRFLTTVPALVVCVAMIFTVLGLARRSHTQHLISLALMVDLE